MEGTKPELLGLLYDTGHLVFSGEDHIAVLKKWIKRVRHVHLKDVRPEIVEKVRKEKWSFLKAVKNGAFTVPGDGCVNFSPVFDELKKAGYEGWWVVEAEQDPAKANPLEYAMMARKYIREKAGI
jgi:inosose dehydratase